MGPTDAPAGEVTGSELGGAELPSNSGVGGEGSEYAIVRVDANALVVDNRDPQPPTGPRAAITGPMQVALVVGIGAFVLGVGVPVLAMLWLAVALAFVTIAGTTLLHTGGLEADTIRPAMSVAIGIAVFLLIGAWRERAAIAKDQPKGAADETWASRNPVLRRGVWLLAIAGLMALAASPGSPYFPSPWATTVLLAATFFLIVVSLVAVGSLFDKMWTGLYRLGSRGPYAAGFLTGILLLLGGAGAWAHREGLSREPWRELRAEVELAKVDRPHGAIDAGLKALCLGAGETEPALARNAVAAPGRQFLPGAGELAAPVERH